jgi:hypothetical protein
LDIFIFPEICLHQATSKTKQKTRDEMTLGGNLINYPGEKSTCTTELEMTKILFNSMISTEDAKFCTMDITNFYLNTPLDCPEYLWIPVSLIPDEIMQEYKLHALTKNDNVMARINK